MFFSQLVEETLRRIQPAQMDMSLTLAEDIPDGLPGDIVSITVSGNTSILNFMAPDMVIAIDWENFYITDTAQTTGSVTAIRGWQGSTPTAHVAPAAQVFLSPKFSRFDVCAAINEELMDLSAPTNGLFRLRTLDVTYNPAFMGYDMSGVDPSYIDVIGVRYKIAPPLRNYPRIHRWAVFPAMTDPAFPSGYNLVVYTQGWPGLPMHVWYKAGFAPLVNPGDDVTQVSGLPASAIDIVPVGAGIILNQDREIKRNFAEAQPDARKAQEVPPGAVMNATKQMQLWRSQRISAERSRLERQTKYIKVHP